MGTPDAPAVAPLNPRTALLAALTDGMRVALDAGDHEAARVAHEAIGRLFAGGSSAPTPVIDLAVERGRRG